MSQSTISRKSNRALQQLQLSTCRVDGEWQIEGDPELLLMARALHQHHRWKTGLPLRLDAQYYSGPLLCTPAPPLWILGNFDFMEVHTPLQLLREGVLDAWIGVFPDTPADEDPDLICFHLQRMPTYLVVAEGHPLLCLKRPMTMEDVCNYPALSLPDNAFPKVQAALQKLGLWNSPSRIKRYRRDLWEGRTLDQLTVGYASPFTMNLFGSPQVKLPIAIDLEVGDALVLRRKFADHPRTVALLQQLRRRVQELAQLVPDVRVIEAGATHRPQSG